MEHLQKREMLERQRGGMGEGRAKIETPIELENTISSNMVESGSTVKKLSKRRRDRQIGTKERKGGKEREEKREGIKKEERGKKEN